MTSHTIVMTGATRGIGLHAAHTLLQRDPDAHLIVLAREQPHPIASRTERVQVLPTDLSSVTSVRAAITMLTSLLTSRQLPPLRALACNAGVQHTNVTTVTTDGFEATFAVNVLANHMLFAGLAPLLQPGGRVVVTASDTHFGDLRHNLGMVPGPKWRDPNELARPRTDDRANTAQAGRTAYSTSKLATIYLAHELARRIGHDRRVLSFNPGFVPGTALTRNADPVSRFVVRYVLRMLTATSFAMRPQRAGELLAESVLGYDDAPSGSYVDRDRVVDSSPESYDEAREAELWRVAESLTGSG